MSMRASVSVSGLKCRMQKKKKRKQIVTNKITKIHTRLILTDCTQIVYILFDVIHVLV